MSIASYHPNHYRPHPKDGGRYCFQFVSPHLDGGGVPGPGRGGGVPGPGQGGEGSQVKVGGSQVQVKVGRGPRSRWGEGPRSRSRWGGPRSRSRWGGVLGPGQRGTQSHVWGGTSSQVQGGYPVLVKGKIFDTRFSLIHVQTGEKILCQGTFPPLPSKGKNS